MSKLFSALLCLFFIGAAVALPMAYRPTIKVSPTSLKNGVSGACEYTDSFKNYNMRIAWSWNETINLKNVANWQVQISGNAAFTQIVLDTTTLNNSTKYIDYTFTIAYSGRVCNPLWTRVAAVGTNGLRGQWSAVGDTKNRGIFTPYGFSKVVVSKGVDNTIRASVNTFLPTDYQCEPDRTIFKVYSNTTNSPIVTITELNARSTAFDPKAHGMTAGSAYYIRAQPGWKGQCTGDLVPNPVTKSQVFVV